MTPEEARRLKLELTDKGERRLQQILKEEKESGSFKANPKERWPGEGHALHAVDQYGNAGPLLEHAINFPNAFGHVGRTYLSTLGHLIDNSYVVVVDKQEDEWWEK